MYSSYMRIAGMCRLPQLWLWVTFGRFLNGNDTSSTLVRAIASAVFVLSGAYEVADAPERNSHS